MAVTRNVNVPASAQPTIEGMVRRMLDAVDGKPAVQGELATLYAYCHIAGGCREMPAETRARRISLIVQAAQTFLCGEIVRVAAIPDKEVIGLTSTASATCH